MCFCFFAVEWGCGAFRACCSPSAVCFITATHVSVYDKIKLTKLRLLKPKMGTYMTISKCFVCLFVCLFVCFDEFHLVYSLQLLWAVWPEQQGWSMSMDMKGERSMFLVPMKRDMTLMWSTCARTTVPTRMLLSRQREHGRANTPSEMTKQVECSQWPSLSWVVQMLASTGVWWKGVERTSTVK